MDIPTLVKHRGTVKGSLTKAMTYAMHLDRENVTLQTLKNKRLLVDNHFKRFEELQRSIEELCTTDEDLALHLHERDEIEQRYLDVVSIIDEIIDSKPDQNTASPIPVVTAPGPHHNSLKLPKLELPKFDGKYEDWQSFEDLFKATVTKNKNISDAEKLSYLRSCVQGEAEQLIKSFAITNAHFKEAWDLLETRYNNKKEIIQSQVRRIINQTPVKYESASSLQQLINITNECLRSLKTLGRETDKWDDLLVVIISDKLDSESRAEWAKSHRGTIPPTYKELEAFLLDHIRSIIARGSNKTNQPRQTFAQGSKYVSTHFSGAHQQCSLCSGEHAIYQCQQFLSLSVEDRGVQVKSKNLCFNCLRSGHSARYCKSRLCRKCTKPHNTLLHFENAQNGNSDEQKMEKEKPPNDQTPARTSSNYSSGFDMSTQVLLKTVKVKVTDNTGVDRVCRALLDDGSQSTFITEECATALGLSRENVSVKISGISGGAVTTAKHAVRINLKSRISNDVVPVDALILPRVTSDLPSFKFNSTKWKHINALDLADPDFTEPGRIDILLGADIATCVIRDGIIRSGDNCPVAQNTVFGWVLSGRVPAPPVSNITVNVSICDFEESIARFWELENMPEVHHLTQEESICEQHFTDTHMRDESGRYICRLPFNDLKKEIGESKHQAIGRFNQLERRFRRQPEVKEEYVRFMREYIMLNHMEEVPVGEECNPCYYLPHHIVQQQGSTTTKYRVVFDGSAKTTSGVSLNQALMVGPTIQDDLFSILIRFRQNVVALKGDVTKMYRQFRVPKEDADFQRILWRENESDPLKIYRLTTVTYGTASAPFTATRCLKQLANDERESYPLASRALDNDTYVDDLLSGSESTSSTITLLGELNNITAAGGMEMKKWATNDPAVLSLIDPEIREKKEELPLDVDLSVKALGIKWNTTSDMFEFTVSPTKFSVLTKRNLLSEIAKVFDPLGWLSPVTIRSKILFQQLWKEKVGWDEELPFNIKMTWESYQQNLKDLKNVRIPRCIVKPKIKGLELHVFSDASEKAYSACVYARLEFEDGEILVNLVAAKTKVAPIKQVSLPRLELCGALLAAELIKYVRDSSKLNWSLHAWSDSTIVLHWLLGQPNRWKTFVANRVSKIQDILHAENWSHVKSEENPADCASRGITVEDLISNALWWTGPNWLSTQNYLTPKVFNSPNVQHDEERKSVSLLSVNNPNTLSTNLFTRYSSLMKLLRVTAYLLRFISICKKHTSEQNEITASEIKNATIALVKSVQHSSFCNEIKSIKNGESLTSSKLSQLFPFLDNQGVLRVGGRLHHCKQPEEFKHPIILPHNHPFSILIIRNTHISNMHSGLQLTLSTLQQQYWILRGRDTVRHLIRRCIICRKQRAEVTNQLMGSLPQSRINPGRPFSSCGVDYAGPYQLKIRAGRGQKTAKCYFAVFVCLATKAIHLECVHSLLTEEFIAGFKRFCARRGIPSSLYSDNGTTFVGADKELKTLLQSSLHNKQYERELSGCGTTWNFNPPSAPHQGGLWEAGVKAVKFHLKRVIGKSSPTIKEFETLLCLVEACVNSRPLCAMSSDPADFTALSPGHFLIGCPLNAVPEPDISNLNINRLSRWQQTQQLFQHFWKRWRGEYLTTLQQRFIWKTKRQNIQVNDLVIIKEDNVPPMKWKLGRVSSVHPGHDGVVRVATIKTETNELKRPINKLCPILTCNDE